MVTETTIGVVVRELADDEETKPGDLVRFDFGGLRGSWDEDIASGCFPAETVAARRARYAVERPGLARIMFWGRAVTP